MAMEKRPPPGPLTTPIPSGLLERDPLSTKGWHNRGVGLGIVVALDRPGADTSPPDVIVNFHRVFSPPAPIFSSATAIGKVGCTGRCAELNEGPGFSCGQDEPGDFPVAGFLRACYLCRKNLDGKDIYMYRGEKAFCSTECRHRQVVADEYGESCSHVAASAASRAPVPYGRRLFEAGIMAA